MGTTFAEGVGKGFWSVHFSLGLYTLRYYYGLFGLGLVCGFVHKLRYWSWRGGGTHIQDKKRANREQPHIVSTHLFRNRIKYNA
jgi:hypothetical protein